MAPSLEGWPTKAKEAPSPYEVRLAPLDTNPVFQSLQTQSLLMDKVIKKQKGPATSDQLFFRLQNKFRKIPLLVIYYLTKFNIKRFLSYSKN